MHEGLNVRRIGAEDTLIITPFTHVDFLHAIERLEESTPELVPAVLAVRDAVDTAFLLHFDDVTNGVLLDRGEGVLSGRALGDGVAFLDQLVWAEEGADVLCEGL